MTDTPQTPDSNPENAIVAFDERTRRVMELRKQVREGTYRPDPDAIAAALLREWGMVGELLEEVGSPMPAVETADDRREAASNRFLVGRSAVEGDEKDARAV